MSHVLAIRYCCAVINFRMTWLATFHTRQQLFYYEFVLKLCKYMSLEYIRRRKRWCKYHIYQWRKDVLQIIKNIWPLFLALLCTLQLQATLERKWWYTKKTIQENRMFSKNRKVWYTNLIYFLCRSLYNTKYWNILILHQKTNGKAVNKFDFLLLPIFYIGNVSVIVTATWLILLKAQF